MDQNIKISIRQFEKLESLVELAQTLSQQKDFNEILRLVTQLSARLLKADVALILMVNPRTHKTMKTVFEEGQKPTERKYRVLQNLISGWVMKNDMSLRCSDIRKDERFSDVNLPDKMIMSVICVPFRSEGTTLGTVLLMNRQEGKQFTENDLTFLEKISVISAPYLRNVQFIQEFFEPPLPEVVLLSQYEKLGLLGKSVRFIEMLQALDAASRCGVRVLLEGQSGTGKELVARAIHTISDRSKGQFVAVDCGAIPANLLESELFGHVKGAFTGASYERKGLFEEANHGTLFMDEIVNLPLEMQSKLMRVLQENEIRPVGSNKARKVDVRIISASSVPLKDLLEKGEFREDLYYRLYVYPIRVPSLEERSEDIPILANHFLMRFAKQQKKEVASFHKVLLGYMKSRGWPGNIRELENFVERMVTLSPSEIKILHSDILPKSLRKEFKKSQLTPDDQVGRSLDESIVEYEKRLIRQALIEHNWNQSQAARSLKISVQTLWYKRKKLGITMPA